VKSSDDETPFFSKKTPRELKEEFAAFFASRGKKVRLSDTESPKPHPVKGVKSDGESPEPKSPPVKVEVSEAQPKPQPEKVVTPEVKERTIPNKPLPTPPRKLAPKPEFKNEPKHLRKEKSISKPSSPEPGASKKRRSRDSKRDDTSPFYTEVVAKAAPAPTKPTTDKLDSSRSKGKAGKSKPVNKSRNNNNNNNNNANVSLDPEVEKLIAESKKMGKKETPKTCLKVAEGWAVHLHDAIKSYKITRQGFNIADGCYWFEINGSKVPRVKLPWLAQFKVGGKFPAVLDQLQSAERYVRIFKPFKVDINDVDVLKNRNFWFKQHEGSLYVYCLQTLCRLSWTKLTADEWDDLGLDWVQSNSNFNKAVAGLQFRQEMDNRK